MQKTISILRKINDIPLVSEREYLFINEFETTLKKWLPKYKLENIDNNLLIMQKNTKSIDNIIFAHIDEIGFLIKRKISENTYELKISGLVNTLSAHGQKIQTMFNNKKYFGVIGNSMPHVKKQYKNLIAEFSQDVDIPNGWPVQFANEPEFGRYLLSKTMDNHLGVACLIRTAMKRNVVFALTIGEETTKQRLRRLTQRIQEIKHNRILVLDCAPSDKDKYYEEKGVLKEGSIGIVPVEGNGKGNIAPGYLIKEASDIIKRAGLKRSIVETYYEDDISEATNLYKLGIETMQICYPLRYIHNPLEVSNYETITLLNKFLECI